MPIRPHHRLHITKFTKFCIVNCVTFLMDVGFVTFVVSLGFSVFYSGICSFILMSVISYALLHRWVFEDNGASHTRASVLFSLLVVCQAFIVGFGLRYLLMHTHLSTEVARMLIGIGVSLIGYLVCHYIIFTKE
jgi:putative flippase GtrA